MKCGREIESDEEEYCRDCLLKKKTYLRGFPLFKYVPPITDSIAAFKYGDRQEYAEFYGEEIVRRFGKQFEELDIECIVPVPLNKRKLKKRGYNQAGLVAKVIGRLLDIPVDEDMIIRTSYTLPQKELDDIERARNLKNAFAPNTDSGAMGETVPESVLLVDDIYTTGATIETCTGICHKIGVKRVYYTSIAR